jgi:hypothetical protein
MEVVKNILLLLLCIVFGSGIWYLIFWFVSNESNLFMWHWGTKIVYLILAGSSAQGTFEGLTKKS